MCCEWSDASIYVLWDKCRSKLHHFIQLASYHFRQDPLYLTHPPYGVKPGIFCVTFMFWPTVLMQLMKINGRSPYRWFCQNAWCVSSHFLERKSPAEFSDCCSLEWQMPYFILTTPIWCRSIGLTLSMLDYPMLKYTLKCASAFPAGA